MKQLVLLLGIIAVCFLAGPRPAHAADAPPIIDDRGDFFSPPAVTDATPVIDYIQDRFKLSVRVVTFEQPPAGQSVPTDARQKHDFYQNWIIQLARQRGNPGIIILIVSHPGHVEVGVASPVLAHTFTAHDRDALRDLLLKHFREHDFDHGLSEGVRLIAQRLDENQQPGAAHFGQQPSTRPSSQPDTRPAHNENQGEEDFKKPAGAGAKDSK